jgi:hypothetical protein
MAITDIMDKMMSNPISSFSLSITRQSRIIMESILIANKHSSILNGVYSSCSALISKMNVWNPIEMIMMIR